MRPLVDARRMREIDRRTEREYGLAGLILMENAGIKAVHRLMDREWRDGPPPGPFVFAAGRGNNGGDALVMARQLFLLGRKETTVLLAHGAPEAGSAGGVNLAACRALGIPVLDWEKDGERARSVLATGTVFFDGLTGTGLSGEASGRVRDLILHINPLPVFKVALDVPSGTGGAFRKGFPAVKADLTLTFGAPKDFLYFHHVRPFAGRIITIDLGFPPALLADPDIPGRLLEPSDFFRLLPPVPAAAHKGVRGHLAVFAGSPGKSGAAVLASLAAARSRAGLVTLFTDPAVHPALASRLVSVMTHALSEHLPSPEEINRQYKALLIGPGFGVEQEKAALFRTLCAIALPKVIDADGLTLLAVAGPAALAAAVTPTVLTPHPGECARLLGRPIESILDNPLASAIEVSAAYQAVCVLKSHATIIARPDGHYDVVDGMNPALGTAGSGDVLAGIISGFLVQGLDAALSARLGVLLHSRVGELAFLARGWFLAEDLLEFISPAFSPHSTFY